MRGGVANFVGTYWPVDDAAAESFAETFYGAVVKGATLGDAVLRGRVAVRQLNKVDWADYIHYGDQQFCVKIPAGSNT